MNNLMSGDNSGAEPRDHDPRCLDLDGECICDELAADDADREAEAILLMEYVYQQYLYDREP
jgi:hypothetical protein